MSISLKEEIQRKQEDLEKLKEQQVKEDIRDTITTQIEVLKDLIVKMDAGDRNAQIKLFDTMNSLWRIDIRC